MNVKDTPVLETDIEMLAAEAHAVFKSKNSDSICQILVNSRPSVTLVDSRYDFGNTVDYFDVTLTISSDLYSRFALDLQSVSKSITDVLNEVHQVDNEYVSGVRIKIDPRTLADWRKQSGSLIDSQENYTLSEAESLWGQGVRIFVSHASDKKEDASELADYLEDHGISVFVAHEDIEPTLEWQREIEKALSTMDGFVALLTTEFKNSDWCGQELGYAVARGVPVLPVRMGRDPYGFIGKIQALNPSNNGVKRWIERKLSDHPRMREVPMRKFTKFIKDVKNSFSYRESIRLSRTLPEFDSLTVEQGDKLAEAINGNPEAFRSWGFSSKRPENGHLNVAEHLTRLTGTEYALNEDYDTRNEWLVRRNQHVEPTKSSEQIAKDDDDDLADLPW